MGGEKFCSSQKRPEHIRGRPAPNLVGIWIYFPGINLAGAWSWPLPSSVQVKALNHITVQPKSVKATHSCTSLLQQKRLSLSQATAGINTSRLMSQWPSWKLEPFVNKPEFLCEHLVGAGSFRHESDISSCRRFLSLSLSLQASLI